MKKAGKLSDTERSEIEILLRRGYSVRSIAKTLGRSPSSVFDEIKRNKGKNGQYEAKKAKQKAYVRRKYAKYQGMKIVSNPGLRVFIDKALLDLQSPEVIAGRLKLGIDLNDCGQALPSVSRSAIEKYLHSSYGEAVRYDVACRKKLFRRRTRRKNSLSLDGRKFIDERPEVVQKRGRLGDLEIDLIISGRGGTGSLLTAVDRRSRVSFVRRLLPVTAENLIQVLLEIKAEYPELKSITADNDILFACHKRLEELLGVPFYFCHPYSSWEKGSVENLNKYIRKFIRKGSNIASFSRKLISEVESSANRRYMKVLGYLTPREYALQDACSRA
jgi:IS30 family transposase